MNRRLFLATVTSGTAGIVGCTSDGDGSGDSSDSDGSDSSEQTTDETSSDSRDTQEDGETEQTETSDSETESSEGDESDSGTPASDVVVSYSTHIQSSSSGEYDLPENFQIERNGWSRLVAELEVLEGELDMSDVWFNGFFETEERLHAVSHDSSKVEKVFNHVDPLERVEEL